MLAGLLVLVALFTFNKIIQNNRLVIFQKYSSIKLPPVYEIAQNTAGTGKFRTDVLLVFAFDKKNYNLLVRQNKISPGLNNWSSHGTQLIREYNPDSHTAILETVYPQHQRLEFRFRQQ